MPLFVSSAQIKQQFEANSKQHFAIEVRSAGALKMPPSQLLPLPARRSSPKALNYSTVAMCRALHCIVLTLILLTNSSAYILFNINIRKGPKSIERKKSTNDDMDTPKLPEYTGNYGSAASLLLPSQLASAAAGLFPRLSFKQKKKLALRWRVAQARSEVNRIQNELSALESLPVPHGVPTSSRMKALRVDAGRAESEIILLKAKQAKRGMPR